MLSLKSYNVDFERRILVKNVLFSFAIAIVILFIGITINFFIVYSLPGDPVQALLPIQHTMEEYWAMYSSLGFDQPLVIQYFRFISDLFTGNWGASVVINRGRPVWDLIWERFPRTIEILLFPTILGLLLGIILGKVSIKFRKRWINYLIQGFIFIGISVPIFFLGIVLQYYFAYQLNWFPASGFKTIRYGDPPSITGLRILDALIDGKVYMAIDTLNHYFLPGLALTIVIIPLMTMGARSNMEKKKHEKSVISNTMLTGTTISLILLFTLSIETTFTMTGTSSLLISADNMRDFYLLRGIIYTFTIFLVCTIFISNIIYSIFKSLSFSKQNSIEENSTLMQNNELDQGKKNPETNSKEDLRKYPRGIYNYFRYVYKYLFLLIGLIAIIGITILASFPQLISGVSFQEVMDYYPNPENPTQLPYIPPSSDYLLGTTEEGRDLFAVVLWGTQGAILVGLGTILIGVFGGVIFAFISSLNRYVSKAVVAIMIISCIIPWLIPIFLILANYRQTFEKIMFIIGILSIPFFTRIIANIPLNKKNILNLLKKLSIYIPLVMALAIIIYEPFSFLGYNDYRIVELGYYIIVAKSYMLVAPWAILWPGVFIFLIVGSLILLHMGLKNAFLDQFDLTKFSEGYHKKKEL
ncbi:MAG: ABC transporter permease subunit [Candidatus Hodarchaeota archaeon]